MTQEGDEIKLLVLSRTRIQTADFINSFANYLTFETFEKAISHPECLINTPFTEIFNFNIKSLDFQEKNMPCWSGEMENDTSTYIFNVNNRNVKLICAVIDTDKDYIMDLNLNGILLLLEDVINEMPVYQRFIERYIPGSNSILVKKIFFINTLGRDDVTVIQWSERVANMFNLNPLYFKENIIIMDKAALKYLILGNRKVSLSEKEISFCKTSWPKYRESCFTLLNGIEKYDFSIEKTLEVIEAMLELLVEHSIVLRLNYLEVSCKKKFLEPITPTKPSIIVPLKKLDRTLNKLPATICKDYKCGLIKVGNMFMKMGHSTCHGGCDCAKDCIVFSTSTDDRCNVCQCLHKFHARVNYIRTNYHEVIKSDSINGLKIILESKLSLLMNTMTFVIKCLAVFHKFKSIYSPNTPNFYKNFIETEKKRYLYYDKIVYDTLDAAYSNELALLQDKTQITKDYVWSILNKLYDLDYVKEIVEEIIKESPKSSQEKHMSFHKEQNSKNQMIINLKPTVTNVKGTNKEIKNWHTNIVYEEKKVVTSNTGCPGFENDLDLHKMRTSTGEIPKYENNFTPAVIAQTQGEVPKEELYAPDKGFKDFKDIFSIIENIKLTQDVLFEAQNCLDKQNKNLLDCTRALKENLSQKSDSCSGKLINIFTDLEKAVSM